MGPQKLTFYPDKVVKSLSFDALIALLYNAHNGYSYSAEKYFYPQIIDQRREILDDF